MGGDVDPLALRAGIAGIHNALVWAEMLPDDPITIDWIPQPDLGYPVTRLPHPRVPEPGIVRAACASRRDRTRRAARRGIDRHLGASARRGWADPHRA